MNNITSTITACQSNSTTNSSHDFQQPTLKVKTSNGDISILPQYDLNKSNLKGS